MRIVGTFAMFFLLLAGILGTVGQLFGLAFLGDAIHPYLGVSRAVGAFGGMAIGMILCGLLIQFVLAPFSDRVEKRLREIF